MNTELYTKLKHCWKMGYKLPKIKEYCETDYSLDDLQELFMEMWESELEAYTYKQECDRVLLSRMNSILMSLHQTQEYSVCWVDKLVIEDQVNGLYELCDYDDLTYNQVERLYNFVDSRLSILEGYLGLYNKPRYNIYLPDQITGIVNCVYSPMRIPENLLGKHDKGDMS